MSSTLSNPLLQQAEAKVASGLDPQTDQNVQKIVVAGMAAALGNGPNSILLKLKQSQDPIADAARGAVSLVLILRKEAHGVMPMKALVHAAMILMIEALGFVDRAGIAKVGQPELVRAAHIFTDFLFARVGITKQGLANAAQRVHALTQDPQAMQAIQAKTGTDLPQMPPVPGGTGMINGAAPA